MVTGQSIGLYSRLHLVVRRQRTLRLVLTMIIVDGILLHTPTIVLTIGSNGPNGQHWAPIFNVMERIQLAIFCIQEFIISTIYIVFTLRLLGSIYHSRTRTVMIQLIIINSLCLSMDVVLIGLEYSNNYVGETSVKAMIYAIKLKLEFAVLNEFLSLAQAGMTEEGRRHRTISGPADRRHASSSGKHWRLNRTKGRQERGEAPSLSPNKDGSSWLMAPIVSMPFPKISDGSSESSKRAEMDRKMIARTQTIDVISEPMSAVQRRDKGLVTEPEW